jgi:hypothetical protein
MKRVDGLWVTAAVLGIAATVGVSTNQTKPPSDSPPVLAKKTTKSSTHPNTPAVEALARGPCPDIEKLLQTFFLVDEKEIVAPGSCYPGETRQQPNSSTLQGQAQQLRFIIATVPDPLHTHFPLIFDRSTEAIEEAAQDDGYVYDSSWLPWETEKNSYVRIDDEDKAQERKEQQEDQPGILLFRRSLHGQNPHLRPFEYGLAVLIVGEEPTGGIHRRQFENAVEWVAALQPHTDAADWPPPLQILGPSFSGSIPSLVELLRSEADNLAEHSSPNLRIFSGSVTSSSGVGWLNKVAALDLTRLNIQFRSFQHSGNVDLDRYCRYMYAAGTDPATLAIVSEDETAFGGEYNRGDAGSSPCRPEQPVKTRDGAGSAKKLDRPKKEGPVYLYYPRDIATLRAAYQSQSIFSQSAAPSGGGAPRHTLQTDLADPEGNDHDTIRSYSGDQTALSQEAELQQMVSLMRAHRTEYIVLRSSNPVDQLFLSHFFRLSYPQGRIVIVGSDLLLRRETGASGLNGVMTLTTYPLLPWEQDWTRPLFPGREPIFLDTSRGRFHSHRAFTNDGVEGAYIAARFLLHQSTIPHPEREITSPMATAATLQADGLESAENGFVPSNCIEDLNLPDYAAPFWMKNPREEPCRHPPTWLSVLGDGGFWPVAVMDFPTNLGSKDPPDIPDLKEKETLPTRMWHTFTSIYWSVTFFFGGQGLTGSMPQAWLGMPPSMKLLMLAGLFWAVFHALCCCRASITVKPAHRAHFVRPHCTPIPNQATPEQPKCHKTYLERQQNSHRALILFGSILVALLPIALAWGYGEMWQGGEPLPNPWIYRAFLPLIWFIVGFAVCANAWVEDNLFKRGDHAPSRATAWKKINIFARRFKAWTRTRRVPPEVWRSFIIYTGLSLILYWCLDFFLDGALNDANRIPTYWRAINLTAGVSPLVPLVSLIAGLYGWFWYSLQGLALFGEDRPQLPAADSLAIIRKKQGGRREHKDDLLRMLSRDWAGDKIEQLGSPFTLSVSIVAGACFFGLIAMGCWLFGVPPIRNLGSRAYSVIFCLWLDLCISMLLANAWQFLRVWLRLRHMLQFLDKLPLRRTLAAFKGFSWGSAWKMSGNVLDMRYKLIFRQMESLAHLRQSLLEWEQHRWSSFAKLSVCKDASATEIPSACDWIDTLDRTRRDRATFAKWYSLHWDGWKARRMSGLKSVQQSLAAAAALMLTQLLIPTWREESDSIVLDQAGKGEESGGNKTDSGTPSANALPAHIRNAEELVGMVYMAFIQNILGRMRSLAMGMVCVFISITVAVASYPFDPRPVLSSVVVVLFVILGATITFVYSQMHRDPTLSNMTGTTPGELGSDFWFKLIGFGVGPVLGLVASVFPEFTGFIFSWVQPGLASLK